MRFAAALVAVSSAVGAVSATTYTVLVGQNATLTYTPPYLTGVQNGDTVQFQFLSKNHTVTQSSFPTPCTNITTPEPGIDSGFMFINATDTTFPVWSITVNNASNPLWFRCRQTNPAPHCAEAGMVFAINPTAEKNFTTFVSNAKAQLSEFTSGTSSSSSSGSAGASQTGSPTGSSTGSAASTTPTSGAGRVGASASLLLAGLAAGLLL